MGSQCSTSSGKGKEQMKVHGIFVVAIIVVAAFGALYLLAYYSPQFLRSPQLGFFRWGLYRQEIVELANEDTIAFTDRPQSLRLVFDVEEPVMYDEAAREGRGQKYLESIVLKYFDKIHLTLFYDDEEYPVDLFNLQPDYSTYVYYGDGIH